MEIALKKMLHSIIETEIEIGLDGIQKQLDSVFKVHTFKEQQRYCKMIRLWSHPVL